MGDIGIVFYDGHCRLCSRSVRWVVRNDRSKRFTYSALPAPGRSGRDVRTEAEGCAVNQSGEPDSVLLFLDGRWYERSSAVLQIALRLRFPWPLLGIFIIVPRFLRDPLYDLVARNRKRWFGEDAACYIA
jgi:predicted DCC family thiol-disulfide oxidoreductase YuxK